MSTVLDVENQNLLVEAWLAKLPCKDFIYQLEYGNNRDEPNFHFQGSLELLKKMRKVELLKIFQDLMEKPEEIHRLHIGEGHRQTAISKYCMDPEKRWLPEAIWAKDDAKLEAQVNQQKEAMKHQAMTKAFAKPRAKITTLYGWQAATDHAIQVKYVTNGQLDPAKVPTRTIMWFVDADGGAGKSTMIGFLREKYGSGQLAYDTVNNMRHLVASDPIIRGMWCINLTRTRPQGLEESELYAFLEELSDGIVTSGKYGGAMRHQSHPLVLVFANHEPAAHFMSKNRISKLAIKDHQRPPAEVTQADVIITEADLDWRPDEQKDDRRPAKGRDPAPPVELDIGFTPVQDFECGEHDVFCGDFMPVEAWCYLCKNPAEWMEHRLANWEREAGTHSAAASSSAL